MTSELLRRRMAIHRRDARWNRDSAVYRAWRKHGEPEAKILAVVEKHMLRETERKAIAVFRTMVPNGYNLTNGGEGAGGKVSAETRRKMSLASKGKPKTAEHRLNISLGQMGRAPTRTSLKMTPEGLAKRIASQRGQKRSEEFKQRISMINKGRVRTEEFKLRVSETMKRIRKERFWSSRKK